MYASAWLQPFIYSTTYSIREMLTWGTFAVDGAAMKGPASKRSEFMSPEGLRVDGRRAGEVRRLQCRLSVAAADGSAYVEQGNTKVLVLVNGPKEASSRVRALHDRALITVEYSAVPFAGGQFKPQPRTDRAAQEMAAAIHHVFEPLVLTYLYPRTQIKVSIACLEADGGLRSAAINATTLALVDAGIALKDFVCASSAGSVHGALLLDPNAQETMAGAELCVGYLPSCEQISMLQLESRLSLTAVDEVIHFALAGCKQVHTNPPSPLPNPPHIPSPPPPATALTPRCMK